MEEKIGELFQKINSETGGALSDFLVKHNHCPGCGEGRLERKDEDVCCTNCGLVIDSEKFSYNIPFGSEHTPGNSLAFGNGMGGTIGQKGLWCLTAKSTTEVFTCPKCGYQMNDLPIRAQQITIMSERVEHPKIMTLKRFGSLRAAEWGFDERKSRKGVIFSNWYGKMLSKVGSYIVVKNIRVSLGQVADACLALCLKDLVGLEKFQEAVERLKIDPKLLQEVAVLYEVEK